MFSTQEEEAETARKEKAGLAVKSVKEKNTFAAVVALVRREGLLGNLCFIFFLVGELCFFFCRRPCPARGAAG